MVQVPKRHRLGEAFILLPLAVSVVILSAVWAWSLASNEYPPSPRLPSPGTIVVATDGSQVAPQANVSIAVNFNGPIHQETTAFDMALTQLSDETARNSRPLSLLVFLCG